MRVLTTANSFNQALGLGAGDQLEMSLLIDSDELLRKPETRSQRRRFPEELATFQASARQQASDSGLRPFSGEVSVEFDFQAPEKPQQPLMRPVVKAYLDALEGIAYFEDRQIGHLHVRRYALDHPMMGGLSLDPADAEHRAHGLISVMPLVAYRNLYDLTFRSTFWRRRHQPWWPNMPPQRLAELMKLRAERHTIGHEAGAGSPDDLIAMLDEERVLDSPLANIDRPGRLPRATEGLHRILPVDRILFPLRRLQGSTFLLPLPGQGPGTSERWKQDVETGLERHGRRLGMAKARLRSWVALDIAVRGASVHGKDLDNLAHSIIVPFERRFCVRPGTVSCYRTYRAVGHPEGVQVRAMSESRMLALKISLGRTHAALAKRA